jgi:glyoxylase-like metal-dependent hydrolase (beta-lactamase superfamily II)
VVVDTGSCTAQAQELRDALSEHFSGPIAALIYTHGDIEQTGGAGVWTDTPDLPIWGTAQLREEFLRRYVLMQQSELRRGVRQFAMFVPDEQRSPSAWGRSPSLEDLDGVPEIRLPNHVVAEREELEIGGVQIHLIAAGGATPDHLYVWLPQTKTLLTGRFGRHAPPGCGASHLLPT